MRLIALTLTAALAASPALAHEGEAHDYEKLSKEMQMAMGEGSGDHSSMNHGEMDHGTMDHGDMDHGEMDHSTMDAIHTTATINSIDGETWNVTHPPIPDLKWPAMTMDLMLLDGAQVGAIEAGGKAMLMLEKGEDGMVGIKAAMPAE